MSESAAQVLPCVDLESQRVYLGTVMADNGYLDRYPLNVRDVWGASHQRILGAILELHDEGKNANEVSVALRLDRLEQLAGIGGRDEIRAIAKLSEWYPGPLVSRLKEMSRFRLIRDRSIGVQAACEGLDMDAAVEGVHLLEESIDSTSLANMSSAQLLELGRKHVYAAQAGEATMERKTGVHTIDKAGGLFAGDLMIIGGDASAGKSSLALLMAIEQAVAGIRVGVVPCEDPDLRWSLRQLSILSKIPVRVLRAGNLSKQALERVDLAEKRGATLGIEWAFRVGGDLNEVMDGVRHLIRVKQCQVVYLDYVQAVRVPNIRERREQIREVVSRMKREMHRPGHPKVAGVALSQFKRRGDNIHRKPVYGDLYESGSLEHMAEMIVLLWRNKSGVLNGTIAKSKDEATDTDFILERDQVTGTLVQPSFMGGPYLRLI